MALGEGRHFNGVVGDESGLYVVAFAFFAENFVDKLAFAHALVYFDMQVGAYLTQLVFVHAGDVYSGVVLDGLRHGYAAEGGLEIDFLVAYLYFGGAVYVEAYFFEHFFGELHHPVVVLVGYVNFHAGELRVVCSVHAFVAEIFGKFVHAVEAAYNKTLQVKFVGDAQIQRNVEGVVVGYERTRRRTASDALQNRSFHFDVSGVVEIFAHGVVHLGALKEYVFDAFVYHQVDVAAAVTQLRVVERVVCHTVFHFHDRQGAQALCQHGEALGVY